MRLRLLVLPVAAALAGCPSPSTSSSIDTDAVIARLPDARLLLDLPVPTATVGRAPGDPSNAYGKTVALTEDVDDTTGPMFSIIADFVVTYEPEEQETESAMADTGVVQLQAVGVAASVGIDLWLIEAGAGIVEWMVVETSAAGEITSSFGGLMSTDTPEGTIEGSITNNVVADEELSLPILSELPLDAREDPFSATYLADESTTTVSATIDLPDDAFARARAIDATTDADGGSIDLVLRSDVVGDADPELLAVRTQWTNSTGGRADASVCEEPCADLASDLLGTLSDCFDADGVTTYIARSWNGNSEGDASTCVFAESLPDQSVVDRLVE